MSETGDRERSELSERIFDLFKKRTDGRNTSVDIIHWNSVYQWALKTKVPQKQVFEAFRDLEKKDLIMQAPGQPQGYFTLTSKGQSRDAMDLISQRLHVKYDRLKIWAALGYAVWVALVGFVLAFISLGFLSFGASNPALVGSFSVEILQTIAAASSGMSVLGMLALAISYTRLNEDYLFVMFFRAYLALRTGNFPSAERSVRKAARLLQSPKGLKDTRWKLVSKDFVSILNKLGNQVFRAILGKIVSKDASVAHEIISLADTFAEPSLDRLDSVISVIMGLPDSEYKQRTQFKRLTTNIWIYRTIVTSTVLIIALIADVLVWTMASYFSAVPLTDFYTSIAASYIPSILAILGLRSLLAGARR